MTVRIVVYGIARDEATNVERWAASAGDADRIVLADTGSTDDTVGRARALGIDVQAVRVEPFRFDDARNGALDLVPPDIDICVALDLDEVLVPGWRAQVEGAWRAGATRVRCWMEWPWSDTYPALRFTTADRIHARHGYRWRNCVHEQPFSSGPEVVVACEAKIVHLRDSLASRPSYLELLRLGAAERPDDARIAHLLANEARMRGLGDEAKLLAHRALALSLEPNELLHTLLMLSHLEPEARESWILAACAEFPARREPWCELAQLHSERGAWRACRSAAHRALWIQEPADDYLTNVFAWGPWPQQLAALASLKLGDHDWALHHARRAHRAAPALTDVADLLERAKAALNRSGGASGGRSSPLSPK
jgi:hypothetical protein